MFTVRRQGYALVWPQTTPEGFGVAVVSSKREKKMK